MAQTLLGRNITFPIYNEDGTPFHDLVLHKVVVDSVVMSLGDNITGDIYYKDDSLEFTMKEYIEFKYNPDDEAEVPIKYVLVNPPTIVREGLVADNSELKGMTKYSFTFYHPMYVLGSIPFTDIAVTQDERKYLSQNKTFSWIGNLFEFVDKLNANLANTQWHVSVNIPQYEADGETETAMWKKAISISEVLPFDKQMISDALKVAYDTWEIPFTTDSYDAVLPSNFVLLKWVQITEIHQSIVNTTSPFWLFIKNLASVSESDNKIYYCKVYKKDTLLYHLIPCMNANNNVGLYDNVSKVFYGSDSNVTFVGGDAIGKGKVFYINFGQSTNKIYDENGNEFIFKMGQGLGLKNNSRTPRNNKIVTRIVGSGSERNIPYGYPQIRWYGNQSWEWTAYTNVVTIFTRSLADFNDWVDERIEAATNEDKIAALTAYKYAVNNGLTSVNPHDSSGSSPQGATYTYSWSVTIKGSYVASTYEDVNINSTYDTSINGGYVIDLENSTPSPNAYPIYMGIVSGQYVKLIKHPFTRTTLMPSEYIETVFDKVSPYMNGGYANPDYDPDTEIVDYIDADSNYPNPINPLAPSVEIHQFEDIYPRLNDRSLIAVQPYEEWDDTMDDNGDPLQKYFKITLPQLDFDLYACASITEQMDINMRSGACMGCTFPIQVNWEDYKANFFKADGTFDPVIHTQEGDGHIRDGNKYPDSSQGQITVIVQKDIDTFGTLMPNVYQQPKGESSQGADDGDKFVILGISLPESYITNAEQELDEAMMSYMLENNIYYYDYPLKIDAYFLATHTDILLQIRNNSVFKFQYANTVVSLNIKQITIKYGEDVLPQYDITLTDDIEVVLNSIGQVSENVAKLNNLISLLKQDYSRNVWSAINDKLSRKDDDAARGSITFEKKTFQKGGTEFGSYIQNTSGASINNNGDAELKNVVARGNTVINGTSHQKGDVVFGTALDKTIAGAGVYSGEGGMTIETDYLHVHKKFFAKEVEIQETTYIGGRVVNSPANGFTVKDVIYQSGYGYVLFFDDGDSDVQTKMTWRVGDQALCQTFNLEDDGHGGTTNHYWWRVVNDCGTWDATGAHQGHLYIRVSDLQGEEMDNSSVPQIGDKVVMLGHRQWGSETATEAAQRQGAIIEASAGATGDVVPFIKIYRGISSFNLEQATLVAELSYDKIEFLANMMQMRIVDGQTTTTQQMTSILGTVNGVSILSGKFESDGHGALRPKEAGGLVLTTNSSGLKLYYLDSNDELHEAQIGLAFNEDEDISTAQISADNINLNGVVTANGFFKINLNGSMEATSGTFSGHIKSVPTVIHRYNINKFVRAEINPYTGLACYVFDMDMVGRSVIFYETPSINSRVPTIDAGSQSNPLPYIYPDGYGRLTAGQEEISTIPHNPPPSETYPNYHISLFLPYIYNYIDTSHGSTDVINEMLKQLSGNPSQPNAIKIGKLHLFRYWYWKKMRGDNPTKEENDEALEDAEGIDENTLSALESYGDAGWESTLTGLGLVAADWEEWRVFPYQFLEERCKQARDYIDSETTIYMLPDINCESVLEIYGIGINATTTPSTDLLPYGYQSMGAVGQVYSFKCIERPITTSPAHLDIIWSINYASTLPFWDRYTLGLDDWED